MPPIHQVQTLQVNSRTDLTELNYGSVDLHRRSAQPGNPVRVLVSETVIDVGEFVDG
jgi:hypothetical protein